MANVKLFANLRTIAGVKEIQIMGGNLIQVLNRLVERYPALDDFLRDDGKFRPHLVITINGNIVSDEETSILNDDTIAIFPPIAGG